MEEQLTTSTSAAQCSLAPVLIVHLIHPSVRLYRKLGSTRWMFLDCTQIAYTARRNPSSHSDHIQSSHPVVL